MGESPMSFWIAKGSPHLLRVSFVFDIPGAKSRTTITARPEVNVDFVETTFAFTPPG